MDPDPYSCFLNQAFNTAVAVSDFIKVQTPTIGSITAIIFAIAALLLSAFATGSEASFFSLHKNEIDEIDDNDAKERIRSIQSKPQQLAATILTVTTIANICVIILLNYAFDKIFMFGNEAVDFVIKAVIIILVIGIFGIVMPKSHAKKHATGWAKFSFLGIILLTKLFSPLSRLIPAVAYNRDNIDDMSLENLSQALESDEKEEEKEKTMLKEILKFGYKTVSEVMTPRVDITDVEWNAPFSEVLNKIKESGYSRMPVYLDNKDNMKGIIYAKDLLPYIGKKDDSFEWQALVRKPLFVPESRMIDDILEDFRKKKIHMAIVVDEYGGTQGIVTLEDVLEEIVGEINDEYDEDEKFYTRLSANTYTFKGKTQLNDFYRVTGLDENDFKDVEEDAETVAGLILNIKHDFPQNKETIEFGKCRFVVTNVAEYRINTVRVTILNNNSTETEDGEQKK